jgi:Ca2+-dependent lipid-binding protein
MSGSSPSNVTTTQNTSLPSWLNNANEYGAGQAQQLYQKGGPQYYSGSTVAPLSSIQEQYLNGASSLGANGNPTLNAANGETQRTLGGQYLDPNSNPYLASTFNQAANAVQNRVSSEFGQAGRNLESSIPVQNDQMNQLATQIYGGNYANERNLMGQAANTASGLNTSNLANMQGVAQAGALSQQQAQNYDNAAQTRWNYNQNLPYNNLTSYMGQVNSLAHGGTSTSSQPVFQNTAGNVLGGALAGNSVGSSLSSGQPSDSFWGQYGGLIGSGVGALAGYMS